MRGLLITLILNFAATSAMAKGLGDITCKSMDPTYTPKFEIQIKALASGQYSILGYKTVRVSNSEFSTSQFWGIAKLNSKLELVWNKAVIELTMLGNNGFYRGELFFNNEDVFYPYELSCR